MSDLRTEKALKSISEKIQHAEVKLNTFRERLDVNPHYAMDWSGDAFAAASYLKVLGAAKEALTKSSTSVDQLSKYIQDEVQCDARNIANQSTSPTSNLLKLTDLEAKQALYRILSR